MKNTAYLNDLKNELETYQNKLNTIQKKFKKEGGPEIDDISVSLNHLLGDAKDAYAQLKSASQEEWEPLKNISMKAFTELRKGFDEVLDMSADHASRWIEQTKDFSKEYKEHAEEYIKENPLQSVLIAAGIGFLLGKIFR